MSGFLKALPIYTHIFSIEMRKIFAYRFDFWSNFFGLIFIELLMAYFLWGAIYSYRQADTLAGFNFPALMFYYLLMPVVAHITQAQVMHFISDEIYQGSINRYLIYPLSFLLYKYVAHLAFSVVAVLQLFVAMGIYLYLFGVPEGVVVNLSTISLGLLTCFVGATLYFLFAAALEMVAFWADNVWSLMVMLKFAVRFLGGAGIPLSFFPEWSVPLLNYLPFYVIGGLPIEVIMGRVGVSDLAVHGVVALIWLAVGILLVNIVWFRGRYQYTGVGI